MLPNEASEFAGRTKDGRFGVRIPADVLTLTFRLCHAAGTKETGGILVGRYTCGHSIAEVLEALPEAPDTKAGRTWLSRGVAGLNRLLVRYWRRRRLYYLGEWHYHPAGRPMPSPCDREQMRKIAQSKRYECPEPILLIVGGGPGTWKVGVFVFPENSQCAEVLSL